MTSLRPCALLALLITFCTTGIASAAGCRIERYPKMPVTLKDMQALIHVRINGAPALLAVDSGAFFSTLSPEGARRYHLTHLFAPPGLFLGGVGGDTQPQLVSARTFTLVHQTLHHVEFLVAGNDYFSHASGVLGDNFLRVADLDVNLGKGYMRFVRTAHCGNLPLAYWAGRRPVGMVRFNPPAGGAPRFLATAQLDGHRVHVLFDTGAGRSTPRSPRPSGCTSVPATPVCSRRAARWAFPTAWSGPGSLRSHGCRSAARRSSTRTSRSFR